MNTHLINSYFSVRSALLSAMGVDIKNTGPIHDCRTSYWKYAEGYVIYSSRHKHVREETIFDTICGEKISMNGKYIVIDTGVGLYLFQNDREVKQK